MSNLWRRLGRRARARVPIFYSPRYSMPEIGGPLDPHRAERILSFLQDARLLARRQLRPVRRVSMRQLRRTHDDAYLESLQDPDGLAALLGFDLPDDQHETFLESQRMLAGGTMRAAREAAAREGVAINLGGGLHHASAERGQGFCAFNDVAVSIADLRAGGFDGKVLVVDLDLHDGDGTRSIFAADSSVHTYSIHNRHLGPVEAVASTSIALGEGITDAAFLAALEPSLPPLVADESFALVYYLAGVDGAADDRLGNWKLSAEALFERDRRVIEWTRERGSRPGLVLLLAGGYGPRAWSYSARFVGWLLDGGATPPRPLADLPPPEYRKIAGLLRSSQLTAEPAGNDWSLSEADLIPGAGPRRFLGYYSLHGVELALERYGFMDRLRALGHDDVRVELDPGDGQTVRLTSNAPDGGSHLLVELRVRRDRTTLQGMELLAVEWLLLQNPGARFSARRPALPGQTHPGLGLVRETTAILVLACERLQLDGVSFVPAHYHVAVQASRFFRFVDDAQALRFAALRRLLEDRPLTEAARLLEEGRVVDADSKQAVRWQPGAMVHPVSTRLRRRALGAGDRATVAPAPRLEIAGDGGAGG